MPSGATFLEVGFAGGDKRLGENGLADDTGRRAAGGDVSGSVETRFGPNGEDGGEQDGGEQPHKP